VISHRGGTLRVSLEDDGVGFDLDAILTHGGLGLFGMLERAEALGGQVAIETRPGAGTTVIIEVPLDTAA
jgi:signal transduction histidine kinase